MEFVEKMIFAGVVWWGAFLLVILFAWWVSGGRGGKHE